MTIEIKCKSMVELTMTEAEYGVLRILLRNISLEQRSTPEFVEIARVLCGQFKLLHPIYSEVNTNV